MIKFNEEYTINDGQLYITFEEKAGKVIGHYSGSKGGNEGVVNGDISGNILTGSWHVKSKGAAGLIEIEFSNNGFEGKWKQGLEPGTMKGSWSAVLTASRNSESKEDGGYDEYLTYVGKGAFVLDHAVPIDSNSTFFKILLNHGVRFLIFSFANSNEAIDEHYAEEEWEVIFDIQNQAILPNDHYSVTEDGEWLEDTESEMLGYLKAHHISIPWNCRDLQSWIVPFYVGKCNDPCTWYLQFHGAFEEVMEGTIQDDLLELVKRELTEDTVFEFANAALSAIRGY